MLCNLTIRALYKLKEIFPYCQPCTLVSEVLRRITLSFLAYRIRMGCVFTDESKDMRHNTGREPIWSHQSVRLTWKRFHSTKDYKDKIS